jgi:secondary thiamine-phosphate synthase enzyme
MNREVKMIILTRTIHFETNPLPEKDYVSVINATPRVTQQMDMAHITTGTVSIFLPGTTAGIGTIEYEEGLISDFQQAWERIIPRNIFYKHKFLWEANNAFSHVRASLMGQSLVVPIANKRLVLGQYQQIVLVEFDNRTRSREVVLQFMGE